ncbi:unnamed protein product, partial [Ectocarpus fasciculatus]
LEEEQAHHAYHYCCGCSCVPASSSQAQRESHTAGSTTQRNATRECFTQIRASLSHETNFRRLGTWHTRAAAKLPAFCRTKPRLEEATGYFLLHGYVAIFVRRWTRECTRRMVTTTTRTPYMGHRGRSSETAVHARIRTTIYARGSFEASCSFTITTHKQTDKQTTKQRHHTNYYDSRKNKKHSFAPRRAESIALLVLPLFLFA